MFLDGRRLARVLDLDVLAPSKFYEDFAVNRIYLRDDPKKRLVEQAYANGIVRSSASQVTVHGVVAEKAANEAQTAAIDTHGGSGWTIEDNEVRYNHGVGINGDSSTVRGNVVHHNGELGLTGQGIGSLVEGNEIAWNNTAGYFCQWECGRAPAKSRFVPIVRWPHVVARRFATAFV